MIAVGLAIFFLVREYPTLSDNLSALFGFGRKNCRVYMCSGYVCRGKTIRVPQNQPCPEGQCSSNSDCAPQEKEEISDVPERCSYWGCVGTYCRLKTLNVPRGYTCPGDQCTSNSDCNPQAKDIYDISDIPKKCSFWRCVGSNCLPSTLYVPKDDPCPENQCQTSSDCSVKM